MIPDDPLQGEIREVKEYFKNHYNTRGALRSPAHLTLHMPFLWKTKKEGRLISLLAQATKFNSFQLEMDGFGAFEPRTIFIKHKKSKELNDFHKALTHHTRSEMNLFNATHNHGFNPHITVAFRDLKKDQFSEAWKEFKDRSFRAIFSVNSFWLLKHNGKVWQAHHEFEFVGSKQDI